MTYRKKGKMKQEMLEEIIAKIESWQNSTTLETIELVHSKQYLYGFLEGLRLSKAIAMKFRPTEEMEG